MPTSCTSSWTTFTFPSTSLTLSSTLCVTFSDSADAICASSWVNLSNLCRCLCSLPASSSTFLHRHLSQVKNRISTQHQLTQSPTFHFHCRDRDDGEYFDHNINNYVRHSRSRCDANVNLKPLKKSPDAVKEVVNLVSASADIFSRLRVRY